MAVLPSIGTSMSAGWGRFLARTSYDGSTFGETLAQQVRFRVTGRTAARHADVHPDSVAARELWTNPRTAHATQAFAHGMLDLNAAVSGGPAALDGFTLSTTAGGYVANRAVHGFQRSGATEARYGAALVSAQKHTDHTAAVRKGGWLHLGPDRSFGVLETLQTPGVALADRSPETRAGIGRGVKTILHELNHVGSGSVPAGAAFDWLSEGSAETLARWPGRVPAAGATLGIEVPTGVGRAFDRRGKPYQGQVDSVRALLALGGLDARRSADFAVAEHLLNGLPEAQLPAVFGELIATRHATSAAQHTQISARIERLVAKEISADGEHADPAIVHAVVAELGLG